MVIIGVLGALILFSAGCTQQSDSVEAVTDAKVEKDVIQAYGMVKSREVKNLVIEFPSSIKNINVSEGQVVKKDEILIEMDMTQYEKLITQKEEEVKISEMELKNLIGENESIKKQINASKSEIESIKSTLEIKKKMYNNNTDTNIAKLQGEISNAEKLLSIALDKMNSTKKLFESGSISKDEFILVQSEYDKCDIELRNLKLSLEGHKYTLKEEIESLRLRVNQKSAEIDKMQQSLEGNSIEIKKAQINMLKTEINEMKEKSLKSYIKDNCIVCDFDSGVISDINCKNGDIINQNNGVAYIVNLDKIYIEGDVEEEFIKDVKVGASVAIIPDVDRSIEYTGKVTKIMGMATQKNGDTTIAIEVEIVGTAEHLSYGYSVDLKISKNK
ncbi:MAG: HlyD family efflux transporter periplasmic adaptor subunit [Clostridiaceae bacterium]|nr:HlyD family efflux transporter periplasmic adaptor subunit [Clostridiaceae bacterium]